MAEQPPDLAAEVTRLQAELADSKAAFTSYQGFVRGLQFCMSKLGEDLAASKRETEAARAADPPWRGMLAEVRSFIRRAGEA